MSEAEPRRSVRATKGQHKALEQLDQIEAPKRRGKKGKKSAPEPEQPEEEIIRCVCGATEQDEDSGEPWIACDKCGAWQHNICMGMSQYSEDLPKEYFCEKCRPENHGELFGGIARGEKPWEARRRAYEEKEAEKKKKKPGKRGKGKRQSDSKDESTQRLKPSPVPESKKEARPPPFGSKRKMRDESQESEIKPVQKMRKVSPTQAVSVSPVPPVPTPPAVPVAPTVPTASPVRTVPTASADLMTAVAPRALPFYEPPFDIPTRISELLDSRQGPAKALLKSLAHSIGVAVKRGRFVLSDGPLAPERAERYALQIERAVHDTHPTVSAYSSQCRTLSFNLKSNQDLCNKLLSGVLTPSILAAMTTEELASKELQKETAEMKARAEKQAIKITDDAPRIRRTHKGDEVIGEENLTLPSDETPGPSIRRPSAIEALEASKPNAFQQNDTKAPVQAPALDSKPLEQQKLVALSERDVPAETMQLPNRTDFDIDKVFSSVKSPAGPVEMKHSMPIPLVAPISSMADADVDRLLDDTRVSPAYSPTEETDPDIVWKGTVSMNSVADIRVKAKHAGGANLSQTPVQLSWDDLIPKRLTVCGRVGEQQATVYLCSLRFSLPIDMVVVSLEPAHNEDRSQFFTLWNYFVSKKRYGVISDKNIANIKDTYLIPVHPGGPNDVPEFMLNLEDNFIPQQRTEPMFLCVFVYRVSDAVLNQVHGQKHRTLPETQQRDGTCQRQHMATPVFSPTTLQDAFPNSTMATQTYGSSVTPAPQTPTPVARQGFEAQRTAEALAREVLGPLIQSQTVQYILPQASRMTRSQWDVIRTIYERDPRTRDDLAHLSAILEKEGGESGGNASAGAEAKSNGAATASPAFPSEPPRYHLPPPATLAAATTSIHSPAPAHAPQHPPHAIRQTPIPPPAIPPAAAGPLRQTPIPPPTIPHHAVGSTGPPV